MIKKCGRFYVLKCDGECCIMKKFTSFDGLSNFKDKNGWCTIKRNLKWYVLCPDCKTKIDNKEVDLNE